MENDTESISLDANDIKRRIFTIRGKQVMLDSDLAELYQVETKNLNKASNRNVERFPEDFRFKLTKEEFENLRFQTGTSSESYGGRRYMPYVTIYTFSKTKLTAQDVAAFNAQYPQLDVKYTNIFHDRFLILDRKTVYHIGASLKDAGKKCFGITLMKDAGSELMKKLAKT